MSPRSIAAFSISSRTKGLPSLRVCRKSRNSAPTLALSKIELYHPRHPVGFQRLQLDDLCQPRALPALHGRQQGMLAVHLVAAVGGQHQHPAVAKAPGQVVEELPSRGVGPVQVLDDEEEAVLLRRDREQGQQGLEEAHASVGGVLAVRRLTFDGELGKDFGQLASVNAQALAQARRGGGGEVVSDGLQEGQVGEREVGLRAGALQHGGSDLLSSGGELGAEPALAHPGVAGQHDHRPLAAAGPEKRILERRELLLSAHQGAAHRAADQGPQIIVSEERRWLPARPSP